MVTIQKKKKYQMFKNSLFLLSIYYIFYYNEINKYVYDIKIIDFN